MTTPDSPRATGLRAPRRRATSVGLALAVVALTAAGCGGSESATTGSTSTTTGGATQAAGTATQSTTTAAASTSGAIATTSTSSASTSVSATAQCTTRAAALGLDQKVGQLFMVGTTDPTEADITPLVTRYHLGSVLLLGGNGGTRTEVTTATARLVAAADDPAGLLVATDQEGGQVQRLKGEGFTRIPSATVQGTMTDSQLRQEWKDWGMELRDAGVRFDLAPVADVVTAADDASNAPVGQLDRNYGTDAATVGQKTSAVVQGLTDAGVASSVKHYPGLGKASANTDYGVAHDNRTTAADVSVFEPAMKAGASSVMVSSSIYQKIDPGVPAVFSSRIIDGLLRGSQGWDKAVVSDDLGAAAAVKSTPAAQRGVKFLRAGGDLVVNADPSTLPAMVAGVKQEAATDKAFAAALTTHVARVLELKQQVGLFSCS